MKTHIEVTSKHDLKKMLVPVHLSIILQEDTTKCKTLIVIGDEKEFPIQESYEEIKKMIEEAGK